MTTTTLTQAHTRWATRPADERFTSLDDMLAFSKLERERSVARVMSNKRISAAPVEGDESRKALAIVGTDEGPALPTNWAFGQFANLVGAPAAYLRKLPADIAADCLNWSLSRRDIDEVGTLMRGRPGEAPEMAAMTGPNYGRVWNADVIAGLVNRFGNGRDGQFTVPGEFGKAVEITKANTTLFASDRDMFAFLADEKNRIDLPNRRNGQPGSLARGFFVKNSEVGASSLSISTFLFDYVCSNRMVWGAQGFEEIRIMHTASAPDRWADEVAPAIEAYAQRSTLGIEQAIMAARANKLGDREAVDEFLAKRFTKKRAVAIQLAHIVDEERPIETLWDAAVGITAFARGLAHQDERVALERDAGRMMALAS
jgi:Domain of unknown function (DUF932)